MKIKTFFTVAAVFAAVWSGRGGIAEFSVGCVNCGAFRYGNDNMPAEESAKEWSRLAADWQQDVFFYEDVGKGAPGNVSMPKFDIRAAVKRQPETAEVVALSRSVEIGRKIQKTPRYRVLRLIYDLEGKNWRYTAYTWWRRDTYEVLSRLKGRCRRRKSSGSCSSRS